MGCQWLGVSAGRVRLRETHVDVPDDPAQGRIVRHPVDLRRKGARQDVAPSSDFAAGHHAGNLEDVRTGTGQEPERRLLLFDALRLVRGRQLGQRSGLTVLQEQQAQNGIVLAPGCNRDAVEVSHLPPPSPGKGAPRVLVHGGVPGPRPPGKGTRPQKRCCPPRHLLRARSFGPASRIEGDARECGSSGRRGDVHEVGSRRKPLEAAIEHAPVSGGAVVTHGYRPVARGRKTPAGSLARSVPSSATSHPSS